MVPGKPSLATWTTTEHHLMTIQRNTTTGLCCKECFYKHSIMINMISSYFIYLQILNKPQKHTVDTLHNKDHPSSPMGGLYC